MNYPVARQLINSLVFRNLTYEWTAGALRSTPIGFTWTGKELEKGTPSNAPKRLAIIDDYVVAATDDTDTLPFNVVLIRGILSLSPFTGLEPDWNQAEERLIDEKGA